MYISQQDGEGSDGGKTESCTGRPEEKPERSKKLKNSSAPSSGGSTDPEIPELSVNIRKVNEK